MAKTYPFSANKYAHNIELVANRSYNLAQEALDDKRFDDYESYMSIHDQATDVIESIIWNTRGYDGIAWLPGKVFARAKELSLLGEVIREGLNSAWKYRKPIG